MYTRHATRCYGSHIDFFDAMNRYGGLYLHRVAHRMDTKLSLTEHTLFVFGSEIFVDWRTSMGFDAAKSQASFSPQIERFKNLQTGHFSSHGNLRCTNRRCLYTCVQR